MSRWRWVLLLALAVGLVGCTGAVRPPPAALPPALAPEVAPEGWTPLGGPPGAVTALVADESTPPTLYAVTRQGVYRSTDSGAGWAALPGGSAPDGMIHALLPVRDTPWTLLAGTSRGLWGWSDAAGWQAVPLAQGDPPSAVLALAQTPPTSLPTAYEGIYLGTTTGVYASTDKGATWQPRGPDRAAVRALSVQGVEALYAATNNDLHRLARLRDWEAVAGPGEVGGSPPQVYALAMNGSGLLAATDRGVWASTTEGWEQLTSSPARALAPLANGEWLVGGDGGVLTARLADDDAANMERGSPQPRIGLPPAQVYALVTVGTDVFAATEGGVYASADGVHWSARLSGLPPAAHLGGLVTITGEHPAELYAGTGAGAFRSDDMGVTWRPIAAGLPPGGVRDLALTVGDAPILLAATAHGVYVTGDGGATWQPTAGQPGAPDIRRLWANPNDPNGLYAASGGAGGLARSWNRGKSWAEVAARLPAAAWVTALLPQPADTSRPYAGLRYLRRGGLMADPGAPAVWQPVASTGPEGGEMAWQPVGWGLPLGRDESAAVTALGRLPDAGGTLLATTTAGDVWATTQGAAGVQWTPAASWPPLVAPGLGGQAGAITPYAGQAGVLYAGSGGVVARLGGPAGWMALGRPPQAGGIGSLSVLPITATTTVSGAIQVLAAVEGRGLWQYSDTGVPPPVAAPPRPALPTDRQPPGEPSYFLYFAETGHNMGGGFRSYWEANNGLQFYGFPTTEEFPEFNATDNVTRTVQYFQRVRLELHTDTPDGVARIEVGLLGRELTAGQFFLPSRFFVSDDAHVYFAETQHALRGAFYGFWRANDGLRRFGFPISEEFVVGGTTMQYFERARFELHPELLANGQGVGLGLLGGEALQRRGWLP